MAMLVARAGQAEMSKVREEIEYAVLQGIGNKGGQRVKKLINHVILYQCYHMICHFFREILLFVLEYIIWATNYI